MSRTSRRTLVSHKLRPFNTGDAMLDKHLDEQLRDHTAQVFSKIAYFDKYTPDHETTLAESASGAPPISPQYPPGDVRRSGIVPNDSSAATRSANSAYLLALLNPQVVGPTGWVYFVNTTGNDTYYFSSVTIEIRDHVRLDLQGCTLDFAGSYSAANDFRGFFTFIRNVELCNGVINVDYDGSAGTNNGFLLRIGGRVGYGFAGIADIEEEDQTHTMGHCWIHDMVFQTNNPGPAAGILLIGGLFNTTLERINSDMGGVVEGFIYYEFGDWHFEATVANRKTTHAIGLVIDRIRAGNMNTAGAGGSAVEIVGANSARVSNVHGDTCEHVVTFRCGEALFYNVGPTFVIGGRTRWHTVSNVTGQNIDGLGIILTGSESAAGGYLSGSGLTDQQQCDLQGFTVENVSMSNGLYCNGPLIMNGGTIRNATSDGIIIGADCLWFSVNGVQILDGAAEGFRANFADTVRSAARKLRGEIIGCKIAGNATEGIAVDVTDTVLIVDNQVGYAAARGDAADESVQGTGMNVSNGASGVVFERNYVTTKAASFAYAKSGGPQDCTIVSAFGQKNISGDFYYGGPRTEQAIPYSASMTPDCSLGPEMIITATNATAFTINAPTNPMWEVINITIRNNSGGALGAATFGGNYKGTSGWVQPANGNSRSVQFRYNGTNWVEVGRTEHDVAN